MICSLLALSFDAESKIIRIEVRRFQVVQYILFNNGNTVVECRGWVEVTKNSGILCILPRSEFIVQIASACGEDTK